MQLTVQIPDEFAQRLHSAGAGDLSRRALEVLFFGTAIGRGMVAGVRP